jgi:hypothetical protein
MKNPLFTLTVFLYTCLLINHPSSAQCRVAPTATCLGTEPLVADGDQLNTTVQRWYYGATANFSTLNMNGGTLVVCGDLTVDKFYMDSGTVIVQPGARFVIGSGIGAGLQLKGNSALYNYGTLEVWRNLSLESGWASPTHPNIVMNVTAMSVFKMSNQYLVINNADSWFVNNGTADFLGVITDNQSKAGSMCLGAASQMKMSILVNKVKNTYQTPAGQACVAVSQLTQLWDTLTATPTTNLCLGTLWKTDSSCLPFGCRPQAWGQANRFAGCSNCSSIALLAAARQLTVERNQYGQNVLRWMNTSAESLEIERSGDGASFQFLKAVHANAGEQMFTDMHPLMGMNYYRLRWTATEGAPVSMVALVRNVGGGDPMISVDGAARRLRIELPSRVSYVDVQIVNGQGGVVFAKKMEAPSQVLNVDGLTFLSKGFYVIRVTTEKGQWLRKVVF